MRCHPQVLVYDGDEPKFSMLFEDEDEHFRHIIDYERFEINADGAAASGAAAASDALSAPDA